MALDERLGPLRLSVGKCCGGEGDRGETGVLSVGNTCDAWGEGPAQNARGRRDGSTRSIHGIIVKPGPFPLNLPASGSLGRAE